MFLLFLVVAGVIALVVVKVINPNKKNITEAAANLGINGTQITNQITSGLQTAGNSVASGISSVTRVIMGGDASGGGGGGDKGGGSGGSSGGGSGSGSIAGSSHRRRLFEQMLYGQGGTTPAGSGPSGEFLHGGSGYPVVW